MPSSFQLNSQTAGAGGKWPRENPYSYISGTECQIDFKTGYEFKFVCCIEIFYTKGPLKLAPQGPGGSPELG